MADHAQRMQRLRRSVEHTPIFSAPAQQPLRVSAAPPRAAANRSAVLTGDMQGRTRVAGGTTPGATKVTARRALWLLLSALLAASLMAGAWLLTRPGTLPISSVRIEGEFAHVTRDELQQAIAAAARGGLFNVDVTAIRRAAQTLPWVHHVTVRRVWPDGLRVSVTEQRAAAIWNDQGLLNDAGEPFYPVPASLPALPQLSGPDGSERLLLGHWRALQKILAPLKLDVTRLSMDERRALIATLGDNMELILGRDEIYARVTRFTRMYTTLARRGAMRRADLRYSNGLAVRWATTE